MSEANIGPTDGSGAVSDRASRPTIAASGVQTESAALAEPAQFRMVSVSFLAAGIGLLAGFIAYLLYNLIGLFTNIVFYHRFVFAFNSARNHHLGAWVIVMPVIGGIIAVAMILLRRNWRHHQDQFVTILGEMITIGNPSELSAIAAKRKSSMLLLPYGIPIAIGTIIYFLWEGLLL